MTGARSVAASAQASTVGRTRSDRRFGGSVCLAPLLEDGLCDLYGHGAFNEIGSEAEPGECFEHRSVVGGNAEEQVLCADVVVAEPQSNSQRLLEPFPAFSRVPQPE